MTGTSATQIRRCAVCDNSAFRPTIFGGYQYREKRYDIVRCRTCGFLFVDPMPEEQLLMEIYEGGDYFEEYVALGSGAVGYMNSLHTPNRSDDQTLAALSRYKPDGRLLDVGCAGGRFAARARELGFEAEGIEPNADIAEQARDTFGIKVRAGTLSEAGAGFDAATFDVIHMADVLEHLYDLHGACDDLYRLLRPGGLLVLQQPVTFNRSFFNLLLAAKMMFRRNRHSQNPPLHLWEFTPSTLRLFLQRKGFRVLKMQAYESEAATVQLVEGRSAANRQPVYWAKALSRAISNNPALGWLGLGDRALVIAQKAAGHSGQD